MSKKNTHNVGILAFGSLIDHPGEEIQAIEVARIKCETPFNVEFARISSTRGNGPTLVRVSDHQGRRVSAQIIILRDDTDLAEAKSILWRRERNKVGSNETYIHTDTPGINDTIVGVERDFMNVSQVLYAGLQSNIAKPLTAEYLADKAIQSILSDAGKKNRDGVRYLLDAKNNNIVTELSSDYERHILAKTETNSLEEAILKLDQERRSSIQ